MAASIHHPDSPFTFAGMSSRMLTLFGEELVPEQMKAAPRPEEPEKDDGQAPEKDKLPQAIDILAGWEPTKQYYSIGEVAKLFSVRTSLLRFWTTEFDLNVRTTRKGDRLYTPAQIFELRTIYHLLRQRGFTIPGARAKLKDDRKINVDTMDLRQALLQLRNQLLTIRNELL